MNGCQRANLRVSASAAALYLATTFISVWLLRHPLVDVPSLLRVPVALLPIAPMIWLIRIQVAMILARDELQRRIDLEAIAIAMIGVGMGSLSMAFLVNANVFDVSGRTALVWVLPTLWVSYGVARHWVARRYR